MKNTTHLLCELLVCLPLFGGCSQSGGKPSVDEGQDSAIKAIGLYVHKQIKPQLDSNTADIGALKARVDKIEGQGSRQFAAPGNAKGITVNASVDDDQSRNSPRYYVSRDPAPNIVCFEQEDELERMPSRRKKRISPNVEMEIRKYLEKNPDYVRYAEFQERSAKVDEILADHEDRFEGHETILADHVSRLDDHDKEIRQLKRQVTATGRILGSQSTK